MSLLEGAGCVASILGSLLSLLLLLVLPALLLLLVLPTLLLLLLSLLLLGCGAVLSCGSHGERSNV